MRKIKTHDPIKIIVGLISNDRRLFNVVALILVRKFGPVDMESGFLPFNHTAYYQSEMGEDLQRKFLSFQKLVRPAGIERIKIFTNSLEKKFSQSGRRSINIDPGYITSGKLVLLTTKNYSHRIYIKKGIYAETTLYFKDGGFQPWHWSYPDYKTDPYRNFFNRVRAIYVKQK